MNKWLFNFIIICISASTIINAQDSLDISGHFTSKGLIKKNRQTFWTYTNSEGFLSEESDYGISAFAKANYNITSQHTLEFGVGGYLSNGFQNELRRSQLYLEYRNNWFKVNLGAKSDVSSNINLSTINQNILVTGNARPLPGILLSTSNPIHIFEQISIEGEIGHYEFNDNRRTKNVLLHYKMLKINWNINELNSISATLRHYVQWGGTLEDGTELPSDFNAYLRIFAGANGGDINNPNEAINALGNHLGSYQINYEKKLNNGMLSFYHQSLFEDRSGRELANFPDGVWGINYLKKNRGVLTQILYEYIQTVSQSGRPTATEGLNQQSGGDNYFRNSIYPSGWTYNGLIVGLPFINPLGNTTTPANNRMIGHHLGIAGTIKSLDYKLKMTYIENLGTYGAPITPRQRAFYNYGELSYAAKRVGIFSVFAGVDFINDFSDAATIGIGYRYDLQ